MLLPVSHMIKYLKKLTHRFSRWMAFNPPGALTGAGWRNFNKEFKTVAPVRYWFHCDFKKIFIYPIKWKYEEIYYWICYRTIDRYHVVKTGLPPGYYEVGSIMLHTNFNLLKDFVEVSQAYRSYWLDDVPKTWCERHMPFYSTFIPFRRPELGIQHLEWASSLDDPSLPLFEQSPEQAQHARETLILYKWWVNERPARKEIVIRHPKSNSDEPYDIFDPVNRQTKEYKIYSSDLDKSIKQDNKWDKEDDKMLVRLMKIRRGFVA